MQKLANFKKAGISQAFMHEADSYKLLPIEQILELIGDAPLSYSLDPTHKECELFGDSDIDYTISVWKAGEHLFVAQSFGDYDEIDRLLDLI